MPPVPAAPLKMALPPQPPLKKQGENSHFDRWRQIWIELIWENENESGSKGFVNEIEYRDKLSCWSITLWEVDEVKQYDDVFALIRNV